MTEEPLIEIRNLSKTYTEGKSEHMILQGVNEVIQKGEFVVLLGRSGSGKSTFLNLISGIDFPTAGAVIFDGDDITAMSEHERTVFRRNHIGFIFQNFNLISTLSVEENLLLPLELKKRINRQDRDDVSSILDEIGLAGRGNTFPDQLSGGEQQRVAIARALLHNPKLVLADEPTGNLDLETAREILDLLDRRVRALGKTLLMVTHSHEVVGLADRILTINDGHLEDITATL